MEASILLLIWRRPNHTRKIIEAIRAISPKRIYISSDGPLENNIKNQKLVKSSREIVIKEIDWGCEVLTNFSEVNKGCKLAVSDAISWFFEHEEEGIILEDDCLPNKDFFKFCSTLLEKYRNDNRVWAICGNGYQGKNLRNNESYFFSKYTDVWGWATWKRCWKLYDRDIKTWDKEKSPSFLKNIFENKRELKYWEKVYNNLYFLGKPDTWDYQWQYLCFVNSGLSCMPYVNLVENIGFGEGATHTTDVPLGSIDSIREKGRMLFPLIHPSKFLSSKDCDNRLKNLFYSGYPILSIKGLKVNLKKIIIKIKKKCFKNFFNN